VRQCGIVVTKIGSNRWIVLFLVTLIAGVGASAYLYWDDNRSHAGAHSAELRANSLSHDLGVAEGEVATFQAVAANPTLKMWTSCGGPCAVGPGTYRASGVPDTFQLQVAFTATVPVATHIFTLHQFASFDSCGITCVSDNYLSFAPTTALNGEFNDAEGCSGYMLVLTADQSGTITPDVMIKYQPSDHPTGVCASSP
jgi:hypothetical protein